jgi:DNA-binding response OmpR family regulator
MRADAGGGRVVAVMRSRSVLVADDDPDIREAIRFRLDAAGYDVVAVADGTAAVSVLAERSVDLVVLDISMPGDLCGIDVCRHIRANPSTDQLPVIMLTSATQGQTVIDALDAGATDYVLKPFNPRELLEQVQTLLVQV